MLILSTYITNPRVCNFVSRVICIVMKLCGKKMKIVRHLPRFLPFLMLFIPFSGCEFQSGLIFLLFEEIPLAVPVWDLFSTNSLSLHLSYYNFTFASFLEKIFARSRILSWEISLSAPWKSAVLLSSNLCGFW